MSVGSGSVAEDIDDTTWIWPEAIEEDTAEVSSSDLLRADSTFWSGAFLPPPPRPPYLEDQISPDGLTTCDLCSWALERYSESKPHSDTGLTFPHNLVVTLTIVSILSALLGAVIMIVLLNCKSRFNPAGSHRTFFCLGRRRYDRPRVTVANNGISLQNNKDVDEQYTGSGTPKIRQPWLMLNRARKTTPVQLTTSVKSAPATNHYTMEEAYTSINEAVYTELDRIPSPAYQNSGYMIETDNEPVSSAPSSAYYSDISAQGTYEMVGQTTVVWNSENLRPPIRRQPQRHFIEDATVHSNYI
ncbi:uncharacterized protein LOC135842507 isoform X2 [Planococcus citri]